MHNLVAIGSLTRNINNCSITLWSSEALIYTYIWYIWIYVCVCLVWCMYNTKLTKYYIKCLSAKLDAFLFRNCILTNLVSFFDRRAERFCLVLNQFFIYVCNKACIEQKVFIVFIVFCTMKYQCKPTSGIDFRERLKKVCQHYPVINLPPFFWQGILYKAADNFEKYFRM